jgi:hypothetical protein
MLLAFQHGAYDHEKLFFTSLDSANSISDIILRKLREMLMVVSLDCTKIELLEEGNWSSNKFKERAVSTTHKKKGKKRSKNSNPVPRPCTDGRNLVEPTQVYLHLLSIFFSNSCT